MKYVTELNRYVLEQLEKQTSVKWLEGENPTEFFKSGRDMKCDSEGGLYLTYVFSDYEYRVSADEFVSKVKEHYPQCVQPYDMVLYNNKLWLYKDEVDDSNLHILLINLMDVKDILWLSEINALGIQAYKRVDDLRADIERFENDESIQWIYDVRDIVHEYTHKELEEKLGEKIKIKE